MVRERGAAAVEFALVLPVLVTLVLGIAEFGRAYNQETILAAAAREAARTMAVQNSAVTARTAAKTVASSLGLTDAQITGLPTTCTSGSTVNVTITYQSASLTGFFGATRTLVAKGAMRCGG